MADELKESILIVDTEGTIAYFNRALKNNFSGCSSLVIDGAVGAFANYLKNQIKPNNTRDSGVSVQCPNPLSPGAQIVATIETVSPTNISGEIVLHQLGKHFTVNIQPLFTKKDFIGQIITFYDITDYQNLLSDINRKNEELESVNAHLKEYNATVEELAVARERNRMAGEIHDSVGHTMTVLISLIGVCSLACDKDDFNIMKQKLDEMMQIALKGHQELKNSVQGIIPESQNSSG